MKTTITAILCVLALAVPTNALAQEDTTERARRILAESQAHHEAGREALAAEGYLQLYEALREIGRAGAPVALWNAGNALAEVPGRERDAIATLRRFLDESTILTDDAQIRTWRSTAIGLIAELEARAPNAVPAEVDSAPSTAPPPPREGTSISPVGPILLTVGGAALLAGVITAGILVAENDALVSTCTDGTCPASSREQADRVQTVALATDILLFGGAVIAATGLALTFVLQEEVDDATAAVTGACFSDGCAFVTHGTF